MNNNRNSRKLTESSWSNLRILMWKKTNYKEARRWPTRWCRSSWNNSDWTRSTSSKITRLIKCLTRKIMMPRNYNIGTCRKLKRPASRFGSASLSQLTTKTHSWTKYTTPNNVMNNGESSRRRSMDFTVPTLLRNRRLRPRFRRKLWPRRRKMKIGKIWFMERNKK